MAEIQIHDGESIENALRRFKRKVQQEDIIKEVKKHSFYVKPGEKKRLKQALARKRSRKKIRREPFEDRNDFQTTNLSEQSRILKFVTGTTKRFLRKLENFGLRIMWQYGNGRSSCHFLKYCFGLRPDGGFENAI